MLTREELIKYGRTLGLNAGQAERDYLQHIILSSIYRRTASMVFKGGTAIKKVYGLDRFSEDLDFTGLEETDMTRLFEGVKKDMEVFGYENEFQVRKAIRGVGKTVRFRIDGPLFSGSEISCCFIYVDISKRETPKTRRIVRVSPIYPDVPAYELIVMSEEEILAEKVRAVMTRNRARDVYDVWYLVRKGVRIRMDLLGEKMRYYNLTFSKKDFFKAIKMKKGEWDARISKLVEDVPDFSEVSKLIEDKFRGI